MGVRRLLAAWAAALFMLGLGGPARAGAPPPPSLVVSAVEGGTAPAADDELVLRVRDARILDRNLFLAVARAGRQQWLSATLPPARTGSGVPGGERPVALLVPLRGPLPGQPPARAVRVLDAQAWPQLLRAVQEDLVPPGATDGVVLDVLQEHEVFVYRDEADAVRSVAIEFRPPERRISRSVELEPAVAQLAGARRLGGDDDVVLLPTGDGPAGYPFAVFDSRVGHAWFLRVTQSPRAGPDALSGVAEGTAQVLTGPVRGLIEQPFSSIARLMTLVTSNAADLLRPDLPLATAQVPVPPVTDRPFMDAQHWEAELDALVGRNVHPGNMRLLVDGPEFFPALLDALENAQRSIDMRMYIFDNDDYARKVADVLKRKSKRVRVRVMLDGLGTSGGGIAPSDFAPSEQDAGGSITAYLTRDSSIALRVLSNPWLTGDHSKSIVIDGHVAFVGGMNIGREYRYEWHDLMVEVRGPVVGALKQDFERTWKQQQPLGEMRTFFSRRKPVQAAAGPDQHPIRILHTLPTDPQILKAQIAAIRRAQNRIYIQNAYFTSDAILRELARARRRGVDVRVILPYRNDSGLIRRSNAIAANTMLANGIRVYIYPGMSHVKGAVYDGWACLGSANFDNLSLLVNRELNLATSEPEAVAAFTQRLFIDDFARSVELTTPFPSHWSDFLTELLADRL